jgi:hypothetical protein
MSDTFRDFAREVGEWSADNFDDNGGWGHAGPFIGIVEELGELATAVEVDDILDAYADTAIYFADFCYRQQIDINVAWSLEEEETLIGLVIEPVSTALGDLAHAILKTKQGIRHYEDVEFAKAQVTAKATVFWYSLVDEFEDDPQLSDSSFYETCWSTWNRVKQRNWKADPRTANQVVEDAVEDIQQQCPIIPGNGYDAGI